MEKVTYSMTEDGFEAVRAYANRSGISVTELHREAIRQADESEPSPEPSEASIRVTFRTNRDDYDALVRYAEQYDAPVSELLRGAVEETVREG